MAGIHELHPGQKRKPPKRVGRGPGSGHGKTSTRGTKGQKARTGGAKGAGFEGGQMPLQRRLPRRGFNNARFRKEYATVNVGALNVFEAGSEVTPELLRQRRLVRKLLDGVKILGDGELEQALTVRAHAFSQTARAKIEAAGGKAEVI
ncbi:MAG: 50S ribosomal protein L15 [Clostridia bacterium]|nr:50S ribosomal protein L15 [Clostridia bacterium]MCL6521242.1 50S ribosomal protein L15 [Bacillota bacterium]